MKIFFTIRRAKTLFFLPFIMAAALAVIVNEQPVFSADTTVNVRDFGAIPDDGLDDSEAIQSAINAAIMGKKQVVQFEAGVYDFKDYPNGGTGMDAYMYVLSAKNLQINGNVDKKGNPATKWIRFNTGEPGADLRQLLYISGSSNVKVKNIIVDNNPYYYSAGKVVKKDGERVTIEVLEGHPRWDGMKAFLPGAYDFENKRFIQQRIIWTPDDGSNAPALHTTTGGEGRRMYVDSMQIANAVKVGDGLFWFQGNYSASAQMIMNYDCADIEYSNVKILNSTGFAITASFVKNLTYRKVSLAPEGNRVATAPRDGFHLNNVSGKVLMDGITIDGICDDGQNCNAFWTTINKKIDEKTLLANPYKYGNKLPEVGSKVKITKGDNMQYIWEGTVVKSTRDTGSYMAITFDRDLPDGIAYSTDMTTEGKSMLEALCLYPESYIVRNSTIRNTYRGLKTSAFNVEISNNIFEYNQYDIFLGAENDPYFYEGGHPRNVVIRNNTFRRSNSGVGIQLDYLSHASFIPSPVMSDIRVFDNDFYDQLVGISVSEARDSYFYDNRFYNCQIDVNVDPYSTQNISLEEPKTASGVSGGKASQNSKNNSGNTPAASSASAGDASRSDRDPSAVSSGADKNVQTAQNPGDRTLIYLLLGVCAALVLYIVLVVAFRKRIKDWFDKRTKQARQ